MLQAVGQLGKSSTTVGAGEWHDTSVLALMHPQNATCAEPSSTLVTHVCPFASVDALVIFQIRLDSECATTFGAHVWTHATRVTTQRMPVHLARLLEAYTTLVTRKWSLIRMFALMCDEIVSLGEDLATCGTSKLIWSVNFFVT
jgi:hypothetical protein